RRHTRFSRDWSSDVYSSDLCAFNSRALVDTAIVAEGWMRFRLSAKKLMPVALSGAAHLATAKERRGPYACRQGPARRPKCRKTRSEERRVGKERRSRRPVYH